MMWSIVCDCMEPRSGDPGIMWSEMLYVAAIQYAKGVDPKRAEVAR